ncbi:hypothetical protein BSL78_06868 [Apostichopus japonicus]|uniref:Ig-like domain-containing protein n=1 Tax=Stichopus japonicus TaxID=307972 RepID=A0A2G8L7W1_STIJA|nr:hypothetical protein BSL78_06868 [Apostichopus japonicus]
MSYKYEFLAAMTNRKSNRISLRAYEMEFAVKYLTYILMFSTIPYQICLGLDWPRLVVNEGQTAKVPCPTQGSSVSYFWKSGLFYNSSDTVASLVHGILQKSSESFDITDDGTLLIHNVSTRQEGRYFCRTTSTSNECHGAVTVYVKVPYTRTRIHIEECSPQSSCTLFLALHATMALTCKAENMPSGTKLIWLNGSHQLDSQKSETVNCGAVEGKDSDICNTIEFVFHNPVGLICLVLSELSRPEDTPTMIAYVTLVEQGDPLHVAWIVAVAVLSAILLTIVLCVIIYTFVGWIKARSSKETSGTNSNRDDRKQKENATVTSDETELDPLIQKTNTIRKDESSKGERKISVDEEKPAEAKSKESESQDIESSKEISSPTEIVMTPPTAHIHPHPSSVTTENESVSTSSASTKQHKLVESKPEKSESQGIELMTEIKPSTKTKTTPPTAPKHVTTEKGSGSTSLSEPSTERKAIHSTPPMDPPYATITKGKKNASTSPLKDVQKAQVNESPVDSRPEQTDQQSEPSTEGKITYSISPMDPDYAIITKENESGSTSPLKLQKRDKENDKNPLKNRPLPPPPTVAKGNEEGVTPSSRSPDKKGKREKGLAPLPPSHGK